MREGKGTGGCKNEKNCWLSEEQFNTSNKINNNNNNYGKLYEKENNQEKEIKPKKDKY